jgi:hypothetical protein
MGHKAMGAHQSARPLTTTWLTPPHVIEALGGADSFDLDPCGFEGSPIPTAKRSYCLPQDGLAEAWDGRVWLNPPYTTGEIEQWLQRLSEHGCGTALIFARTETEAFQTWVMERATGVLFLRGRLHFHDAEGVRAKANAGAPSVLCAYGQDDLEVLAASDLPGSLHPLRFARSLLIIGLGGGAADLSWAKLIWEHAQRNGGSVCLSDLYRAVARHPKAKRNPNWRAKVRQTLQRGPFRRIARGAYAVAA